MPPGMGTQTISEVLKEKDALLIEVERLRTALTKIINIGDGIVRPVEIQLVECKIIADAALTKGPSLADNVDGSPYTPAQARYGYKLWAESWVIPLVKALVPELKKKTL